MQWRIRGANLVMPFVRPHKLAVHAYRMQHISYFLSVAFQFHRSAVIPWRLDMIRYLPQYYACLLCIEIWIKMWQG